MYTGIVHSSYKKAVLVLYTRDVILHYFFSKNSLLLVVNVVYQQALPSVFTIALGGSQWLRMCRRVYLFPATFSVFHCFVAPQQIANSLKSLLVNMWNY